MDPFAAIGLAGNIITFLEFGYNVISAARHMNSVTGASSSNQALASMTEQLNKTVTSLSTSQTAAAASQQNQSITKLATECRETSQDLLDLLKKLHARNPKSFASCLKAAFREMSWKKKDEVYALEKRLDRYRQQLILELAIFTR